MIDGDTLEVICLGVAVTIRLRNCWAPEVHRGEEAERSRGLAAKKFLQQLATPNCRCIVWIPTSHATRLSDLLTFGRVLGEVWLSDDKHSLSELMIAQGYATGEKP